MDSRTDSSDSPTAAAISATLIPRRYNSISFRDRESSPAIAFSRRPVILMVVPWLTIDFPRIRTWWAGEAPMPCRAGRRLLGGRDILGPPSVSAHRTSWHEPAYVITAHSTQHRRRVGFLPRLLAGRAHDGGTPLKPGGAASLVTAAIETADIRPKADLQTTHSLCHATTGKKEAAAQPGGKDIVAGSTSSTTKAF